MNNSQNVTETLSIKSLLREFYLEIKLRVICVAVHQMLSLWFNVAKQ